MKQTSGKTHYFLTCIICFGQHFNLTHLVIEQKFFYPFFFFNFTHLAAESLCIFTATIDIQSYLKSKQQKNNNNINNKVKKRM